MEAPVLVVEDDDGIADLIEQNLRAAGFSTRRVVTGDAALDLVARGNVALLILDIVLPGMDGYEVTRRLRQSNNTPILMLTARTSVAERVLGLELGADDYLTKPFSPEELVARVRAVLRRSSFPEAAEVVARGNLRIDPLRREVRRDSQLVPTTKLEFEVLHFLAHRPGRVYSRTALMRQVWGDERIVDARSVDSLISRLRRKLEDNPDEPRYLKTVWGAGYRFNDSHP